METNLDKLEFFVVDDDPDWRKDMPELLGYLGYRTTTASSSYDAIDQLAIRLYKGEPLPDIYLCDMLDRDHTIAMVWVRESNWSNERTLKEIYPAIAFNVHNYLSSKGITPQFFMGYTAGVSEEDRTVADRLKIPLVSKLQATQGFIPDVSGLSKEEALQKFTEHWKSISPYDP